MPFAPPPPQAIVSPAEPAQVPPGGRYDAAYWREHLEAGVRAADDWTRPATARYREAVGPYYSDGYAGGHETHCGWYWKFESDLKPALVAGDPAVSASSTNPDATGDHAEALEYAMNRVIKEQGLADELDKVAGNMLWCGGCLLIVPEAVEGKSSRWMAALGVDAPVMTARCRSLDFSQILVDPDNEIQDAAWMAHWEVLTVTKILEMAAGKPDNDGWDLDAVRAQAEGGETDAKAMKDKVRGDGIKSCSLKRDELVVYRVWCRETQMIHTIAYRQVEGEAEGRKIREDQPWTGHDRGPYVWFGVAWVRGRPFPLALTAVAERLVRELDDHRRKAREDAEQAKKCVGIEGANTRKRWAQARNGDAIEGDAKGVKEASAGGVQAETFEYIAYLESELEKMFGLSQVRQGDTEGSSSATAIVAAETAQGVRRKYFERRFKACVREAMKRIAHILWHNQQVEMAIPQEDPMTGEKSSADYFGGVAEGDSAEWEHVESEIDLEPYTMGLVDQDSIRRSMTEVGVILQDIMAQVISNPLGALVINWEAWLDDRMEAANIPGGGKRYINYPAMRAVVRMQLQGLMGAGMGGEAGGSSMGLGGMGGGPGGGGVAATPMTPGRSAAGGSDNPMDRARSAGSSAGMMARGGVAAN